MLSVLTRGGWAGIRTRAKREPPTLMRFVEVFAYGSDRSRVAA
jgi:hypothetical protein